MRCALAKTGALRQRRLASSTAGGTSASLPALLMILGLLLACAKAAERFERQEPPLQTARQQQRPLPVAGGGSCCWRRALVFQAAFAAQEKPAQRKRRADLAGPAGQTRAAAPEAAGFGLEPHGATTATAPGGRYREPLLAPRSDLCKHPQGGAAEISQRKRKRPQARGNIKRVGGWAQKILIFRILPVFSGEGMVKVCVLNCLFFEENMV